jgi:pimeloyl-ACP methyl ester carboxylesterase
MMPNYLQSICLTAAICCVVSCAARQSTFEVIVRNPKPVHMAILKSGTNAANSGISDIPQYAVLASLAYEADSAEAISCGGELVKPGLWRSAAEFDALRIFPPTPAYRIKIPGLSYRVFEQHNPGRSRRFAIVFRGTSFNSPGDWYSNSRWITRLNPATWDQYQQARSLVKAVERELESRHGGDFELVAVGHSLGGGLAQQAAYASQRVRQVYAFNTSPVTGATSIDQSNTSLSRRGDVLHRVYESGEVLAALRWASRRVLPLSKANPRIIEYRFNFRKSASGQNGGGAFGEHGMRQVACDLVCRVQRGRSPKECGTRLQ